MTQSSSPFRYSLAGLLALVTLFAVACGLFAARSPGVMYGVVSSAALLFCAASLTAIIVPGRPRAACAGLAVIGWGYLLLTFHPWFANLGGNLLTTRVLVAAWNQMDTPEPPRYRSPEADLSEYYVTLTLRGAFDRDRFSEYARELRTFFFIGQAIWAIALGLLGGLACGWLHDWQRGRESTTNESS